MQKRFTCLIMVMMLFYVSSYAQYCLPTYSFQCTSDDYINNVTFGSINNLNTGCSSPSANNYTDYSATLSTIVNPGQNYPITVQSGPTFGQGIGVWIDFNQDLDFADPGEFVYSTPNSSTASQVGTVNIPALAFPGPTRMRVLCRYASVVAAGDYCGSFNFGECEDYTVIVANPSPDDLGVSAITGLSSGCGLGTNMPVTITVQNYGTNTQSNPQVYYAVSYNGGAFSAPVSGLLSSTTITSGSNAIYTFGTGVNLSNAGTYVIQAWTALPNDGFTLNDTFELNITSVPTISSYPYIQTFDNGVQGWSSGGTSSTWAWGTPNKPTINGAYSGSYCWVTSLTGNYSSTENSYILGPCFDMSSLILPVVEMAIWWECESGWDGARVQSSIDGGTTWQTVGFVGGGQNWYNTSTVNMLNTNYGAGGGWSGWFGAGSGGWLIAKADLAGLGGQPDVMLRVVFAADGGVSDGVAIDNFKVYDKPPIDMGVSAISLATGCGYSGGLTPVPVTIENFGTDPQVDPDVFYMVSFNGGPFSAPTIASAPGTWNPGTTQPFSFMPGYNFGIPGDYTVVAWTEYPGDPDPTNDSTYITFTSIPEVLTFPYVENFNASNGGWVAGGTNSTWAWGDPSNKPIINTAYNGANCWVTNLTGDYSSGDVSWLRGPCFNFSGLVSPVVEFAIWWDTESNYDGCRLQSSIDGGATWQTVGAVGSGQNWYNNTNFSILNSNYGAGPGWGGYNGNQSGGWLMAKNDLTGLGGQPSVLLRFVFAADVIVSAGIGIDGFKVYEKPDNDLAVTGFLQPNPGGCGSANTTVQVVVKNQGLLAQSNFPVSVFIPEIPTTLTTTYTGSLAPNATANVTIGTFNSSTGGTYTLQAYTALANDQLTANDTMIKVVDYAALALAPTVFDGLTCSVPASVELAAAGGGEHYYWYDAPVGGNLIGMGDTIMSPTIGATTTYYVEARNLAGYKVGPVSNSVVGPGFFTTTIYNLNFTVNNPVVIDSVLIYYSGTGTAFINIAGGTPFQSTQVAVPVTGSGAMRVPIGLALSPGTYAMSNQGSSTALYVNYTGAVYPYISTDPLGSVQITSSTGGTFYYNGFYDWYISVDDCPSPRVPVNAVVSTLPNVNLGNDAIVCYGYVLDGTTGTGNTYSWNSGELTPAITIANTGQYMLDVTNPDGCTASDTIIMTVLPSPTVNLGADIQSCNTSVVLDAGTQPTGNAYQWSSNAGASQTQTVTVTNNGSYWVAVTNPQGCTDYDSVSVSFVGVPLNLGPDVSQCTGAPVVLNAGNIPGVSYSWSTGQTSPVITVATAGLYYVVATNGNCTSVDSINVGYGTPPTVNLGPDKAACGPVTLDAGNLGATFSWSTGASTQAITVTSSNNYSVTVTAPNGCATTDAINVAIYQPTTGSVSFSQASGALFNFSSTVNAAIPYTYSWDFGDPNSANNTSSQQNPAHSFSTNGTYVVTLYINNICGSTPLTTTVTVTTVGVEDEMWNAAISIYPNPNTGIFAINGTEIDADDLTVDVYNLQGQVVASKHIGKVNGTFSQEMDLQNLAKGIYLVNIQDGGRRMYRKVVIE